MKLSITYIALKDYSKIIPFFLYALKIKKQLKASNCIGYRISGFLMKHYTMSLWQNGEDMKQFINTGAHLEAMIGSRRKELPIEDSFLLIESDKLMDWKTAKKLLMEKGRFTSSRNASV